MSTSNEPIPVNDLRRSSLASDGKVREAVARVIASGRYIEGPEHAAFEAELAGYLGVRHAIGVASGTDALALALLGVGCTAGSEIVTVANAGGYSSVAAAQVGCDVVYADVDPVTLLMTAGTLEVAVGPQTRAVVVTHLYGNVAEPGPIVEFCRARGIAIVEDCAQAIGGEFDGRRAGTFGIVAAFSFYPTKNLGAAGDGGAVATDDGAIAARIGALRHYGWGARYAVAEPHGRNSRLDELQAAILRIGLRRVDEWNGRRRAIVERYAASIRGPNVRLVTGAGCPTVAHLAVIQAADRARMRALFEAGGVGTDVHYPTPDHYQVGLPPPRRATPLAETERAAGEVLTLPCFPSMTQNEVDRVSDLLAKASLE
jgi:dTDP-3-amino-2,3,6-trideoxy-4-keto-D-glucose/dTDP-3-amino-3,4,6-trideoxy-alpha-D-glucose/dTDP-2,6-dideoxy-D-kanosamine transaminase